MKEKNSIGERDREATEKRLLDTIERMIVENGFEKIGVNAVAAQSGVSKILIYRLSLIHILLICDDGILQTAGMANPRD